jgi:hypothetical protein
MLSLWYNDRDQPNNQTQDKNVLRTLPQAHVIILEPGDVLAMRLEKTRTTYRADIDSVFRLLARRHAAAELRRRKEERKKLT